MRCDRTIGWTLALSLAACSGRAPAIDDGSGSSTTPTSSSDETTSVPSSSTGPGTDGADTTTTDSSFDCEDPPLVGYSCPPIEWAINVDYVLQRSFAVEVGSADDAPCTVYGTGSLVTTNLTWREAGVACTFPEHPRPQLMNVRTRVPPELPHPLRLGDQLLLRTNDFGTFALEDASTGELVLAGVGNGFAPDPDVLAPFEVAERLGECDIQLDTNLNGCITPAEPFALEVRRGEDATVVHHDELGMLGDLGIVVSAFQAVPECSEGCGDGIPSDRTALMSPRWSEPGPPGCDLLPDSCPDGSKCVPVLSPEGRWDSTACVGFGATPEGMPCVPAAAGDPQDECADGLVCAPGAADPTEGVCRRRCLGSLQSPMCATGAACVTEVDAAAPPMTCIAECDPIADDCPEPAEHCFWDQFSNEYFSCQVSASLNDVGDECMATIDCLPSLACISQSMVPGCAGTSCCAEYCSLAAPSCPAPSECLPWFDEQPISDYADLGICAVPPP